MDGEFGLIGILKIKDKNGQWQGIPAIKGDKGEKGSFEDLTEEQKESLRGPRGFQGEKGDPFEYEDFTAEQLALLKGEKGDKGEAFKYEDFTPAQLEALTGPIGPTGPAGKDYILTNDDKNEIAQIVLAEFPTAEEVSV